MWVIIRLAIAATAFLLRFSRIHLDRVAGTLNGMNYYYTQSRTRSGAPSGFRIKIPVDQGFLFSFHYESSTDRFFKSLGLAAEVQTGDANFDSKIYVTCDHTGLRELLRGNEGLRKSVLQMMQNMVEPKLRCDGRFLIIEGFGAPLQSVEQVVRDLIHFQNGLSQAAQEIRWAPFWKDAYFYKALVAESLVWSIAAYGISSLITSPLNIDQKHAEFGRLLSLSLTGGLIAAAAGLFLMQLWFKGSSRGHRILVESAILLLIGLPTSAFQATQDLNRELDTSSPVEEIRTILDAQERRHYRRKGRPHHTYHLYIGAGLPDHSLIPEPRWIQVSYSVYDQVRNRQLQEVKLVMRRGWLGVPWYQSMTFLDIRPDSR